MVNAIQPLEVVLTLQGLSGAIDHLAAVGLLLVAVTDRPQPS